MLFEADQGKFCSNRNLMLIPADAALVTSTIKRINNKKVLLRERKRQTARRVEVLAMLLCVMGGVPQVGGYPISGREYPTSGQGGTPSQVRGVPHLR